MKNLFKTYIFLPLSLILFSIVLVPMNSKAHRGDEIHKRLTSKTEKIIAPMIEMIESKGLCHENCKVPVSVFKKRNMNGFAHYHPYPQNQMHISRNAFNANIPREWIRFTIAHELSHALYDQACGGHPGIKENRKCMPHRVLTSLAEQIPSDLMECEPLENGVSLCPSYTVTLEQTEHRANCTAIYILSAIGKDYDIREVARIKPLLLTSSLQKRIYSSGQEVLEWKKKADNDIDSFFKTCHIDILKWNKTDADQAD